MEQVVLVDESGVPLKSGGQILTLNRERAHRQGILHLAVSVFIFDMQGNPHLLLQKRSYQKDHSGGLWANTCCTHPREGEDLLAAANRCLLEEMGLQCYLEEIWSFCYRAEVSNGLIEHEYDHVFLGFGSPLLPFAPNAEEVANWDWADIRRLRRALKEHPEQYAPWFRLSYDTVLSRSLEAARRPGGRSV